MTRPIRSLACLAAAAAVLCAPSLASAEVESTQQTEDGQIYKFLDDLVDAPGIGSHSVLVRVRPDAARTLLIRPRASFVREMFKSVENI